MEHISQLTTSPTHATFQIHINTQPKTSEKRPRLNSIHFKLTNRYMDPKTVHPTASGMDNFQRPNPHPNHTDSYHPHFLAD